MRFCDYCGDPLHGQASQRFCRLKCRVAHHRARALEARAIHDQLNEMDFSTALQQMREDDEFAESIWGTADLLLEKNGHAAMWCLTLGELDANVAEDGSGYRVSAHQPRNEMRDIERAAESGDWSGLVETACMNLRREFPDVKPDLSAWPDIEAWFYGRE